MTECGHPIDCSDRERGCLWCLDLEKLEDAEAAREEARQQLSDANAEILDLTDRLKEAEQEIDELRFSY